MYVPVAVDRRRGGRNPVRDAEIVHQYRQGDSLIAIAVRYGLTRARVYQIVGSVVPSAGRRLTCRTCGSGFVSRPRSNRCYCSPKCRPSFYHLTGRPRGPLPRNATRDAEIVRLRGEGLKLREIAARYGIDVARVYRILEKAKNSGRRTNSVDGTGSVGV